MQSLQDYFGASVGPIRKAELAYDSTGRSKGTAVVIFHDRDGNAASKAAALHNVKVDGKAMRVSYCLSHLMSTH